MQVQFEIPEDLAGKYPEERGGASRAAVEALALEGIRSGLLTEYQARLMLGIPSRYEMDGFLKAHDVYPPYTLEDYMQDGLIADTYSTK